MSQTWSLPISGSTALSSSRTPINDAAEALRTLHSGTSAPSSTVAYMLWADTTNNLLKQRDSGDAAWTTVAVLNDTTNWGFLRFDGSNAMTGGLDLDGQQLILDADADTSLHASTDDQIDVEVGGSDVAHFTATGLKIGGTADHGTTPGTNVVSIFNGTAPVGTLTNGASLYTASGELTVIDSAGNTTVLS